MGIGQARGAGRGRAVLLALLVTFLWSTSWIFIKWGLADIPPLAFAGLRYATAFVLLAPILWVRRAELRALRSGDWILVVALGVVLYALTQGSQFLALANLDATTLSLCLSMTVVLVALIGSATHKEAPRPLQWIGVAVAAAGAAVYFLSSWSTSGTPWGFAFAALAVAANAAAALLGRQVNRRRLASPLVVTAASMGVGAALLLGAGWVIEGVPELSARSWGTICWLGLVNTALAFTLWSWTQQVLTAVESSVINNTMLIQVAFLAWAFLGETQGPIEIVGLAAVAFGTFLVQWRRQDQSAGRGPLSDTRGTPPTSAPPARQTRGWGTTGRGFLRPPRSPRRARRDPRVRRGPDRA